jgi:hypothetical protein
LRQVLGDELSLVVRPRDLTWRDTATCRVDLREFDLCRAAALASDVDEDVVVNAAGALDRYRGEFLPGQHDEWILDVRGEPDGGFSCGHWRRSATGP